LPFSDVLMQSVSLEAKKVLVKQTERQTDRQTDDIYPKPLIPLDRLNGNFSQFHSVPVPWDRINRGNALVQHLKLPQQTQHGNP
jgi:hypothetical protein